MFAINRIENMPPRRDAVEGHVNLGFGQSLDCHHLERRIVQYEAVVETPPPGEPKPRERELDIHQFGLADIGDICHDRDASCRCIVVLYVGIIILIVSVVNVISDIRLDQENGKNQIQSRTGRKVCENMGIIYVDGHL